MKNMIKLLLIAFVFIFNKCQDIVISEDDTFKYELAYNYVANLDVIIQTGKGIYISDTLFYFDFTNFGVHLINEGQNQTEFVFMLDSLDSSRRSESYFVGSISDKIKSDKSSTYTLYFSKIYDNVLIVELISNNGNINQAYHQIIAYNNSTQILFKFDDENQIEDVYNISIAYD